MNIDRIAMSRFNNGDIGIAYFDVGPRDGVPVLLIHGFASTAHVNWVFTGWVRTLSEAGYRVIALDNRGHGESDKPHDAAAYTPPIMAGDSAALLDHLGVASAGIMGYSMGARLCAFLALAQKETARTLVFGGLGAGLIDGVGEWDKIAAALLAPSLDDVTDERGRMFRAFADQTGSDRKALAACIQSSRTLVSPAELNRLTMPALVAVGTKDDIAGSPDRLAAALPDGRAVHIENRDHMLSVGDRIFKSAVLGFYEETLYP
ncbi:MAG: alpha/beta hydrolase [Alphaproteobacteria bacterium]|nr:alpha/beta hydrolase [Alphaproteobacteria bacterium]